jgi:MFS family permease
MSDVTWIGTILREARALAARVTRPPIEVVKRFRAADGQDKTGMHRLIDVHALSCAGDALVAIGLAGTIFFEVPVGEARSRVALYLLVTMAPFALLAPVVGPVLDRFPHGRRYAIATTMLARAFLAYAIADRMDSFFLYPAAFGVLVMSRAYGVARSAVLPRLLPPGLSLVAANARSSLAGIVAAAVVVPIGIGLAQLGPEWPLRAATVVFFVCMVIALRLPGRADSDVPETVPRLFTLPGRREARLLTTGPVWAAVTAAASFRALYGFLTLFFAFRTREDDLGVPPAVALGLVVAGLGAGSLIGTVAGTRLRLERPVLLQFGALALTATVCTGATIVYGFTGLGLLAAVLLAVTAATGSGLAKLAVDAVIQQSVPEEKRASAFAHSETVLQLAFVVGGAVGLIPIAGQWGLAVAAVVLLAATVRVGLWVRSLRVPVGQEPVAEPLA